MPPRLRATIHSRVAPSVDVALCGLRGILPFAASLARVSCPTCHAKKAEHIAHPQREQREYAARQRYYRTNGAVAMPWTRGGAR